MTSINAGLSVLEERFYIFIIFRLNLERLDGTRRDTV
jgi:hypothetical protein